VTIKIFWQDPYCSELDATVAEVAGPELRLDRTIFFAESGGQESDRGSIAGMPVLAARWQGREIVYALGGGHGLAAGQAVRVAIDWPRRYRLMRLHFAAEIILELVYQQLKPITKIDLFPIGNLVARHFNGFILQHFYSTDADALMLIGYDKQVIFTHW